MLSFFVVALCSWGLQPPVALAQAGDTPAEAGAEAWDWRALLISGGGVPSSNAVAHEKNLRFVDHVLRQRGLAPSAIQTFVSVGAERLPDTAYLGDFPSERWELVVLSRLFGGAATLGLRYRPHEIPDPAGSGRKPDVMKGIRESVAALKSEQTLFIYTTDHGVPDTRREGESALVLWGDETLSTQELRSLLDAGSQTGAVVLHMTQCFSGGFAHTIFAHGTTAVTEQNRCGFFSTLPDRIATGCTPELNEADYDDYTTRFFAALAGRDRVGRPVPSADYNGDGRVSLAEAHAYAVGTQDTVDVPMKTSEFYLERIGIRPSATWKEALTAATPDERAAWRLLSEQLDIEEGDPSARIGEEQQRIERQRRQWHAQLRQREPAAAEAASQLRVALLERWPVLETPFHPDFASTLLSEGEAIRSFLSGAPAFAAWQRALGEMSGLHARLGDAELEEAWWLRAERHVAHLRRVAQLSLDHEAAVTSAEPGGERDLSSSGPSASWAALERLRTCEAEVPEP